MDRRKFLRMSAITASALAIGGGAMYAIIRDSDILDDHFEGTEESRTASNYIPENH